MSKILLCALLTLFTTTSVWAIPFPQLPISQDSKDIGWEQLVQYAIAKGERVDTNIGTYCILTDLGGKSMQEPHIGNYFSVIGGGQGDQFGIDHTEVIWENWTLNSDGNRNGDLWQYVLTRDGQVRHFMHSELIEDQTGTVLSQKYFDTPDQERDAKLVYVLQGWYQRIKANTH